MADRPRIAVVSPFLDKKHGTERCVVEELNRLADRYEIHLYCQRVEDVDLSRMVWHRIPQMPGPHLANFLWWLAANHAWRWWDGRIGGLRPDLVFTTGTNCFDADVIAVYIVFAEFARQTGAHLGWKQHPVAFWPRLLHRKVYYRLIRSLERRMYSDPRVHLILIARKTAEDLKRFYGRVNGVSVVYMGLDQETFHPEARRSRRREMRAQLGLREDQIVLLLIGNDWKKKGLPALLESLRRLANPGLRLLVAGQDDPLPYQKQIREAGLEEQVRFLPPRADVISYYAAADVYAGPSLEDTFALPPLEAMACALPVITSVTNGTAEIIVDGVNGLLLANATDVDDLTEKIRRVTQDAGLRDRLGEEAVRTARQLTWDRNSEEIGAIFDEALRKSGRAR
jgi:glycosyltransferase involved in cell wall biosynthesis